MPDKVDLVIKAMDRQEKVLMRMENRLDKMAVKQAHMESGIEQCNTNLTNHLSRHDKLEENIENKIVDMKQETREDISSLESQNATVTAKMLTIIGAAMGALVFVINALIGKFL